MSKGSPKVFLAVGLPASIAFALALQAWQLPLKWTDQGWDVAMLILVLVVSLSSVSVFHVIVRKAGISPAIKPSFGWLLLGLVVHWAYSFGRFQASLALGLEVECAFPFPNGLEFVTGCLVGPLAEETVFRALGVGAIMSIRSRFATAVAVFVSALVFAASHHWYGDMQLILPIFEAGIVYGILFSVTAKLWPVVLLHSVDNLLTLATEVSLHVGGVPWCEI